MDQNDINVSSYSIFDNPIATNNAMISKLEKCIDDIINNTDNLYDANIFDGPIANICQEEIIDIGQAMFSMRDSFTPISSTLDSFSQNYQQADKKASNTVSSVGQ